MCDCKSFDHSFIRLILKERFGYLRSLRNGVVDFEGRHQVKYQDLMKEVDETISKKTALQFGLCQIASP